MSIINHEHRHIFIHVPKCAGTSMERQPFVGGTNHHPAMELAPQALDYFSWGFVRNPYDRLLSAYASNLEDRGARHRVVSYGSFANFVLAMNPPGHDMVHSARMVEFLCCRDGQIAVDFVGRFEDIDADWSHVCDRIGVGPTQLPASTPAYEHRGKHPTPPR